MSRAEKKEMIRKHGNDGESTITNFDGLAAETTNTTNL